MAGILLSGNNIDLARSLARPICSAEALRGWAQTILGQTKKYFSLGLSRDLLSLGLPAGQLPVVELAGEYITPDEIEAYLQEEGLEEIALVLQSFDPPDSMSRADFEKQFEFYDAVMDGRYQISSREEFGLGEWISSLLPETDEFPRTLESAIRYGILRAWPNATVSTEERVVGKAGREKITARCLVFRKMPTQ